MATTPVPSKQTSSVRRAGADTWQAFRTEMDRLFDRFSGTFFVPSMRNLFDVEPLWRNSLPGMTMPAVDVSEDEKAFKITAELPGMSEKNVEVTLTGDAVLLKGEKTQEHEEKGENRYLSERSYGAFQRSFYLPDGVARDKVTAEFNNGVLTILLPKTTEAQAQQKIEVKAA